MRVGVATVSAAQLEAAAATAEQLPPKARPGRTGGFELKGVDIARTPSHTLPLIAALPQASRGETRIRPHGARLDTLRCTQTQGQ